MGCPVPRVSTRPRPLATSRPLALAAGPAYPASVLTGVHLLLTYRCTLACDHCFVFSSPQARGTFTRARLRQALEQAAEVGTVEWIYLEGGEPFLLYPLMIEGLETARAMGFRTGVVTNAYWAETEDDAALWLEPLARLGVEDLSVSDDAFHHGDVDDTPARRALAAAGRLGIPASAISIPHPSEGEGVRFRGRAADTLTAGRPTQPTATFTECPDEDLADPGRVHLDAWGNVHLCQGVLLGNAWETPLAALLEAYEPAGHPVCGPLLRDGPAALAAESGLVLPASWASACHLCFDVRRRMRTNTHDTPHLGPAQVYEDPTSA